MRQCINNLNEFQEKKQDGFDSIAVDIVGFCNAKCKYCPAGNDLTNKGRFISLELFEQILMKLIEYKFYSKSTNFHIYCLGEPCLHPQINDILRLLMKYGIHTTISTNASYVPQFDPDALESVDRFLISMPGFSQDSYNKIHGFNFLRIKENIVQLRKQVKELSTNKIPFDMSYHIYQFNEREMIPAKKFCDENEIRFAPNYAVMMDKDKCLDYVTGRMEYEELKDVSKEVFLGVLDQQIQDSPRDYCDFQSSFLSVNIKGDIRICSGFRRDVENSILIGNIVTDNINDIIWRKYHHPRCDTCIKAGLTLEKGYECKVYLDGYYSVMKENEFILKHKNDNALEKKLELMKLIREFEYSEYPGNMRESIQHFIKVNQLEDDVKDIALGYTRFGIKTYKKIGG